MSQTVTKVCIAICLLSLLLSSSTIFQSLSVAAQTNSKTHAINHMITASISNTWTNVTTEIIGAPGARSNLAENLLVYDAADGYDVLFGGTGCGNTCVLGDTWILSNGQWINITKSSHPSPRTAYSMVYDAADGYVLLFGGFSGSNTFSDTWAFSHGSWTKLHPAISPSPRENAGIAYDAKDGYVVLFAGGNNTCGGYADDTWSFKAGAWTKLSPSQSPSNRVAMGMTYDYADGYVVMFGGSNNQCSSGGGLDDTWSFSGGQWTQLSPSTSPDSRYNFNMVFNNATGFVILYGGWHPSGGCGSREGDTWSFSGGNFQELLSSSGIGLRAGYGMTYDAKARTVLLVGGELQTGSSGGCPPFQEQQDTWEYGARALFDVKHPTISSLTAITNNTSNQIIISGSGFGSHPKTITLSDGSVDTIADSIRPSLAIHDQGLGNDSWAAGHETRTNLDAIGVYLKSWNDSTIVLNGFGKALHTGNNKTQWNIALGDPITVVVFGPNNDGIATDQTFVVSNPNNEIQSSFTTLHDFIMENSTTIDEANASNDVPPRQCSSCSSLTLEGFKNSTITGKNYMLNVSQGNSGGYPAVEFSLNQTTTSYHIAILGSIVYNSTYGGYAAFIIATYHPLSGGDLNIGDGFSLNFSSSFNGTLTALGNGMRLESGSYKNSSDPALRTLGTDYARLANSISTLQKAMPSDILTITVVSATVNAVDLNWIPIQVEALCDLFFLNWEIVAYFLLELDPVVDFLLLVAGFLICYVIGELV